MNIDYITINQISAPRFDVKRQIHLKNILCTSLKTFNCILKFLFILSTLTKAKAEKWAGMSGWIRMRLTLEAPLEVPSVVTVIIGLELRAIITNSQMWYFFFPINLQWHGDPIQVSEITQLWQHALFPECIFVHLCISGKKKGEKRGVKIIRKKWNKIIWGVSRMIHWEECDLLSWGPFLTKLP